MRSLYVMKPKRMIILLVSNENWILYDLITDYEQFARMIGIVEAIEHVPIFSE